MDRWSGRVDKPFLNGDGGYALSSEGMPWPYGPIANNMQQRIEWTEEFMNHAFARPEFVGWHYCGLIDTSIKNHNKTDRQHSGLLNEYGEPYESLQKSLKKFSENMYQIASDKF